MHNHSKSGLFLMEMIISILFFSLASAVCIQLFVKSHTLDNLSRNTNEAILHCENAAEIFLSCPDNSTDGLFHYMCQLIGDNYIAQDANASLLLYYSDDWKICSQEHAVYQICVVPNVVPDSVYATIVANKINADAPLYELSVKKHIPMEAPSR